MSFDQNLRVSRAPHKSVDDWHTRCTSTHGGEDRLVSLVVVVSEGLTWNDEERN